VHAGEAIDLGRPVEVASLERGVQLGREREVRDALLPAG